MLWSPATPTLIDARLELRGAAGELLDAVQSYTALRSAAVQGDRVVLKAGRTHRGWCSTKVTGPTAG